MRVVFLGYQIWGSTTLKALIQSSKHVVPLVVTHPVSDHPYERIWPDSVPSLAEQNGISVLTCHRIDTSDLMHQIKQADPDILLSSNWRSYVKREVLDMARLGGINIHDGLLPRYGGFSPVNWSLINGETKVGVTVHFMNEELDLGDIIMQEQIPVSLTDTAVTVLERILPLFGEMALRSLDTIENMTYRAVQQDRSQATFFHKRTERDSEIDWSKPYLAVYNLIRAQATPYPNAYTFHHGRKLFIQQASLPNRAYCGAAGRVFCRVEHGVVIVCGAQMGELNQGIVVEIVQPEGGEPMSAQHYFNRMGDNLG